MNFRSIFRAGLLAACCLGTVAALAQIPPSQDWFSPKIKSIDAVSYSTDGSLILLKSGTVLTLWQASGGKLLWSRTIPNLGDAHLSADSSVVFYSTSVIKKLSAADGSNLPGNFSPDPNATGTFAVSPHGKYLAVFAAGAVRVYNAASGNLFSQFNVPDITPARYSMQFMGAPSNDSRLLIGTNLYTVGGTQLGSYYYQGVDYTMAMNENVGSPVATIEHDGHVARLTVFDVNTFAYRGSQMVTGTIEPLCAAVDRSGSVVIMGQENYIALYSTADCSLVNTMPTYFQTNKVMVASSPVDGRFAVVGVDPSLGGCQLRQYVLDSTRSSAILQWARGSGAGTLDHLYSFAPDTRPGSLYPNGGFAPVFAKVNNRAPVCQLLDSLTGNTIFRIHTQSPATPRARSLAVTSSPTRQWLFFTQPGGAFGYSMDAYRSVIGGAQTSSLSNRGGLALAADGPMFLGINPAENGIVTTSGGHQQDATVKDWICVPTGLVGLRDTDLVLSSNYSPWQWTATAPTGLVDFGPSEPEQQAFWTFSRSNAVEDNFARFTFWHAAGGIIAFDSKTFTIDQLPGGTFGGWVGDSSSTGWSLACANRKNAAGKWFAHFFFYLRETGETWELEIPVPFAVADVKIGEGPAFKAAYACTDGEMGVLQLPVRQVQSFTISDLIGGKSNTVKFRMAAGAPNPVTLSLSTSPNLHMADSTTLAAGVTSKNLPYSTDGVDGDSIETITSTWNGASISSNVTLHRAKLLRLVAYGHYSGGHDGTVLVQLDGKAGPSGITVNLVTDTPSLIQCPPSVDIPAQANNLPVLIHANVVSKRAFANLYGTTSTGENVTVRLYVDP